MAVKTLVLFSALDKYYKTPDSSKILFCRSIQDNVKISQVADSVEFPGIDGVDAVSRQNDFELWHVDEENFLPNHPVFHLSYDTKRRVFQDPYTAYPALRAQSIDELPENISWRDLWFLAVLKSRYNFSVKQNFTPTGENLSIREQKLALTLLFSGIHAAEGLELLGKHGFVHQHWPETSALFTVYHSKEFHPEGDGWEHTVETLRHWKKPDITLGLALFLHDIGKPSANSEGSNTFHKHAQLGGNTAARFLRRLGFEEELINEVRFLVREHMLPEAIPRIPFDAIDNKLTSPYFPRLLELFRCDLLSTFQGPEKYYAACKRYKKFLKYQKNPYEQTKKRFHASSRKS